MHHYGSGGMQEEWRPGHCKMQQELQPQKGGQTSDRTSGLLMKRIGQLQSLARVCNLAGAEQAVIRKQLVRRLRADCECPKVPAVTANLADPLVIKSLLKKTHCDLEQHRLEAGRKRSDGWHAWLAAQRDTGDQDLRMDPPGGEQLGTQRLQQTAAAHHGRGRVVGALGRPPSFRERH